LLHLEIALHYHFQETGNLEVLNKSISVGEYYARLSPEGEARTGGLLNLGGFLMTRFRRLGDFGDLDRAVSIQEDALELTPDSHPDKAGLLENHSYFLYHRFECLGNLEDLNLSVSQSQDAIRLTPDGHPGKGSRLNRLAESAITRFERLGDLGDLNTAVLHRQAAFDITPDGDPVKPELLSYLSDDLRQRFEHCGELDDLRRSVSSAEQSVHLTPDGPTKRLRLNNLANSLMARFQRLGEIDDLNTAISIRGDVVQLTPDGDSAKAMVLSNCGNSLYARFEQFGDLGDLKKAVVVQEDAVRQTPERDPYKPLRLHNLGNSLFARFERLGNLSDLNECVGTQMKGISLIPDGHHFKPSMLNSLGRSLFHRFTRLGNIGDLNVSVTLMVDAVRLTPKGHAEESMRSNNLGNSLAERFQRLGNFDDLQKSMSMLEEVVRITPEGHPDRPMWLNNLGNAIFQKFKVLGDYSDLEKIIHLYRSTASASIGPAHVRFRAASWWAKLAQLGNHASLMDAYCVAIDLLPELAWLGLSISDRHHHITEAGSLVRNAAATAIIHDQPETAVEWLEQGRSIIWGQMLHLRTPVDALKQKHPGLAAELIHLSSQLEEAATRSSDWEMKNPGPQKSPEASAGLSHENAYKQAKLLQKIRELEGFERFLLPKTISELSVAAQEGPVVFLNVSDIRCDALILVPGLSEEVMHLPLTDFTAKHSEDLKESLESLTSNTGLSNRLLGKREGTQVDPEDLFTQILSELWVRLVKPILDSLAITTPKQDSFQRIWWCPTGPLTFLPIHAAGLYGRSNVFGPKVSDFVISSYTPSLAALIAGRRPQSVHHHAPQLLAVAQPSAFGHRHIPGTQQEIDYIQLHSRGKLPVMRLEKESATVGSVQKGMMDSSWAHFACHGVQDAVDPTQSALLVAGSERLTLSSIIKLSLPHADFAFLSACQTAAGDQKLQDESIHLAAGMLLAGYRGVIATMWTIMDNEAPQVAADVYQHLLSISPPDPTRAAEALHLAVRMLCEGAGGRSFSRWVPFIHVG
ncbi:CHAT domain-containing protein, partial [Mycena galopus ATCC 62051]